MNVKTYLARRIATGLLVVVALGAVASEVLLAAEPPYDTNAECFECHGVASPDPAFAKVPFGASAVDYSRCASCHGDLPHGDAGEGDCRECHPDWPARDVFYSGAVQIPPIGWFDDPESLATSAATLHEIHINGSWLGGQMTNPTCDACHQAAACGSCHGTGVDHKLHTWDADAGAYAYPGVTYEVCNGSSMWVGTYVCADPSCHDLAAPAGFPAPPCAGCHAAMHDLQDASHDGGAAECGDGCHEADDVSDVHPACGACHGPTSTPASADCLDCHAGTEPGHHSIHDASSVVAPGCANCHQLFLDDEHVLRLGYECSLCHASDDPVILGAVAVGDRRCDTCHPARHYRRSGR